MNDENTPRVNDTRSAIIVFRFSTFNFGEVSHEASYADSRTLHGLACAPRTIPHSRFPCGEPAVSGATTGYDSFNLLSRRSFHFELQVEDAHEITFARTASDAALIAGSTARLARSERDECLSEWASCSFK